MEISKRIKNLIKLLQKYDKAYEIGESLISDREYDDLYYELENLEKKYKIIYPFSPTQSLEYKELNNLEKVRHQDGPMLSLSKTKEWEEVLSWTNNKPTTISLKLDGLSCRLIYENGELIEAHSRGNGEIGNLVTNAVRMFTNVPISINEQKRTVIDGEAIIPLDAFQKFKDDYANPRNLAAGTLSLLDTSEIAKRKMKFVAWGLITSHSKTYTQDLDYIATLGFEVVPHWNMRDKFDYESCRQIAEDYHYGIDGLVIRYNDNDYYKKLGHNSHDFYGAKAFKFYNEALESKLKDIQYEPSRNGTLTPVAIFESIQFDDAEVTRATLHNLSVMEDKLGYPPFVGQKIWVIKANEIIPEIDHAEKTVSETTIALYPPRQCPFCNADTQIKVSDSGIKTLYCPNEQCSCRVANVLDHYASRAGMDIRGLSKSTLDKLIDWGWVNSISDLYTLSKYELEWSKKEGFGATSVRNILAAVEQSKSCKLEKFLVALGIPQVGPSAARTIVNKFNSWADFFNSIITKFNYSTLPNFGEEIESSILNYDYTEANYIANNYLNFQEEKKETSGSSLEGLNFVITGSINNYKNRNELQSVILSLGGKASSSVSSKTDYLICNDKNSNSSKARAAKELNIPIITEEEFQDKFLI